jgi:hypothetical protein
MRYKFALSLVNGMGTREPVGRELLRSVERLSEDPKVTILGSVFTLDFRAKNSPKSAHKSDIAQA